MKRSLWRFFPLGVVAGLGLVVVVNAGMVYAALHSFPGQAGDEGFELSNHYDAVLDRQRHEAALGWAVVAHADAAGRPEVVLTDRDGAPLQGALVMATAERPLGAPEQRALAFREMTAGRYVADAVLPEPGQWELTLSASFGGQDMLATRRVIVH
jgi:nitrogen fixation protein FixH